MPFDLSGNFTRSYNYQQDRDNGIKILAARVDGEFDNFATGMNLVFFRDGRVAMSSDLRMGINRVSGLPDGIAASPALKFNSEGTTGPYLDGVNRYGISVAGTLRGVFTTTGFDTTGNLTATGAVTAGGVGVFKSPGSGTVGGVRIVGNAGSADSVLQFTDSTQATEFANIRAIANTLLLNATNVQAPTPGGGDNSTKIATTAWVTTALAAISGYAPLASPAFTGTPTAPTAAGGTNTTQIATTAFVQGVVAGLNIATYAPLASPTFTGTPAAPTAAWGVSTTQVATTAFVDRLRALNNSAGGGKTLDLTDRGGMYQATGAVTVPSGVFAAGDVVVVYNNSAAGIALTQGGGLTLRWSGTATTGSRTLLQRGLATITYVSGTEAVVSGDLS